MLTYIIIIGIFYLDIENESTTLTMFISFSVVRVHAPLYDPTVFYFVKGERIYSSYCEYVLVETFSTFHYKFLIQIWRICINTRR